MRRGVNLPAMGGFNRAVVLDLIRRSPSGLSRVELAERSGLSSQTVTNVSRRLLDTGLIREAGKQISGPGKPRTILQLVPEGGHAVGVHLDPSFITYVVVDLETRVVAHSRSRTPTEVRPDDVLRSIERSIDGMLEELDIDRETVFGLGIAAPGPIDRDAGIVDSPPLLPGWNHVPLRSALLERLQMPVALEKDVTAAAAAELWVGGESARDDFAFFYYGTGVGLGIAVDHEVARGSSANIGDIGHLIVRDGGRLCGCGMHGCLGENVSPLRMVVEARDAGILALAGELPTSIEVDEGFTLLCERATAGDTAASLILRRAAEGVARAIVMVANLPDLGTVICGGPFWDRLAAVSLDDIRAEVDGSGALVTPHPVRVESSKLGTDVTAIGAACQVLDAVLSPRPAALLIGPRG